MFIIFGHTRYTCQHLLFLYRNHSWDVQSVSLEALKNLADLKSMDLFNWELTNVGGCREVFELLHNLALVNGHDWYNHEAEEDRMRTEMSTNRMEMAWMKRMILILRVL